jgi:hypothetical protein
VAILSEVWRNAPDRALEGIIHELPFATTEENVAQAGWKACATLIFTGIAHVLSHATKDENGSQAGRLCHSIFKGGS